MKSPRRLSRKCRLFYLSLGILLWSGILYTQRPQATLQPEAILVLGGEPQREQFAAKFARQHPELSIWVSGGSNPEYAEWVFESAKIQPQRVHLDYEAVDTLTNFTTMVAKLEAQNIKSVYLVTSEDHMRRACWIAEVILGSRDIQFEPIAFQSQRPQEPWPKAAFDRGRAMLWVVTGYTGTSFKPSMAQRHP